ncbi:15581_t:CDS:2 [Entrophospora sp. SA101]|nr:15581_t:CDS:2 [Entrophospora sp. SA101]
MICWNFWQGGVAVICERSQKSSSEEWKVSGNFSGAATICLSTHYARIDDAPPNPYISLYMQLGSTINGLQLTQEPMKILTKTQNQVQNRICNGSPPKGKSNDPMIWTCLQPAPDNGSESQKLLGLLQKLLAA